MSSLRKLWLSLLKKITNIQCRYNDFVEMIMWKNTTGVLKGDLRFARLAKKKKKKKKKNWKTDNKTF